jgi:acyl carrier protein
MTVHEITQSLLAYLVRARPGLADLKNLEQVSLSAVLDSLEMLDFLTFVEQHFQVKINSTEFTPEQFSTVSLVSQFISHKLAIRERNHPVKPS